MEKSCRELTKLARLIIKAEIPMKDALIELQAEVIRIALKHQKGNRTHTADMLQIGRATLNAQIKKLHERSLLTKEDLNGKEI